MAGKMSIATGADRPDAALDHADTGRFCNILGDAGRRKGIMVNRHRFGAAHVHDQARRPAVLARLKRWRLFRCERVKINRLVSRHLLDDLQIFAGAIRVWNVKIAVRRFPWRL